MRPRSLLKNNLTSLVFTNSLAAEWKKARSLTLNALSTRMMYLWQSSTDGDRRRKRMQLSYFI